MFATVHRKISLLACTWTINILILIPILNNNINVTECIVCVSGHDPLTFPFLSFLFFDWVGVLYPQLSKLLKLFIVQELCESRGGRPELSVLTSLLASVDVKIY